MNRFTRPERLIGFGILVCALGLRLRHLFVRIVKLARPQ